MIVGSKVDLMVQLKGTFEGGIPEILMMEKKPTEEVKGRENDRYKLQRSMQDSYNWISKIRKSNYIEELEVYGVQCSGLNASIYGLKLFIITSVI